MIKLEALEKTFNIQERDSRLLSMVVEKDPGLRRVLDSIGDQCPVADTCRPFDDGTYHRMKGHVRSFVARTDNGVLVIKGTEPMSKDYGEILVDAEKARDFLFLSKVDWFLIVENEPFLGQALNLAENYARISLEFTQKYVARFGKLPRVPFPVGVFKIPQAVAEDFGTKSAPYACDRPQLNARERLGRLIQRGLGVFVYYYPGQPIRAAHARGVFPGSHEAGSYQQSNGVDWKAAISGWLDLIAEMMIVGYFPTYHIHQGNCLQPQNLVIDGGMCDIDSLHPMSKDKTDLEFMDSLFYSLLQFCASVTSVLTNRVQHTQQLVWGMMWPELVQRVHALAKDGCADPRILDHLKPMSLDLLFSERWMNNAILNMRQTPIGVF
jgi:hypothetical protein